MASCMTYCFSILTQNGESWKTSNCTIATCANSKVTETPTPCPTVQQPICANGRKVIKVYDDNGCCFNYQCECVCSVWGGSHYMTFDGKLYTFNKNCSYYLVKEIITKYNLTVIVNNADCDPADSTFCPQALTVTYQSYKVVLTQLKTSGTTANVVYVNLKRIYPAYSNSVLRLTSTDMMITLEIPEIKTKIVYKGSSFSIDLPYSLFGGITEGQCGTCDNSQTNDCRSPNGQVESCSDSAGQWHVPEHMCPGNKVYMACGPTVEPTCNERYNKKFEANKEASTNNTKEGCFCPYGTILFNTIHDTCVTSCDCVGPDGKPKQPGDTWTSDCNNCVCDKDSMSIQCEPVQCPSVLSPNCSKPGYQLINKTDGCCTSQTCVPKGVCVYNMTEYKPGAKIPTPQTPPESPLEAPFVLGQPSETTTVPTGGGQISGTTTPPSGAGEATLGSIPEESFKPSPCQECYCGSKMDPITKLNIITCKPIVCNTNCSKGYEYQTVPDKCCGMCVPKDCVFTTPDNTLHIIEVNSTFIPPSDKCVQYTCEKINGHFITKETKTTCPFFNPLDCEPGTETSDANGCCKMCKLRSVCEVQSKQTVIEVSGCKSTQLVNMTSCSGHCGSSSVYSAAANTMMHQCECCQEATTSQRQVELICPDGSKVQHNYTTVQTCHCSKADCVAGTTPKPHRRRRR
ncbi:hypothetical protein L3Q82_000414 [Scortum barcoo]|uniref:Uncharacterized protein n=1 Tax=Scortum barcoo TaxID=214431 RepID=A0ACB8X9M8_9TELE|nr:hypothetical protein L3Q82_000414 [Scortum barcoo]